MDEADLRCSSHCAFVAVAVGVEVGLRRLWLARAVVERREATPVLHRRSDDGTEAKADMVG